jgi:ribose/xylose/arabinose/galactoside ABC-type transport system permease subunit
MKPPDPLHRLHNVRSWFAGFPLRWPVVGLVALLVFNVAYHPGFIAVEVRDGHLYGTPVDLLHQGAKGILLAIGMTLVIASGGIDLSVGSVMAIAGALAALLARRADVPLGLVIVLPLGLAAAAGLWNGLLVTGAKIQPIIATLILMTAGRGLAMLLTGGQNVAFERPGFIFLGNGHLLGLPFTICIVAAALAAAGLLLRRTALGLFLESTGDNERASRACGVEPRLVKTAVYVVSGACAGLAGLVATSNIKQADPIRVGEMMELDAIFAVVVGGTALTGGRFTLAGSVVGALLIQTLTQTMFYLGIPPPIAPVPKAIIVLAVCLLQSARFRRDVVRLIRTPVRR